MANSSTWSQSEDENFIINQAGEYDIKFVNSAGIESDTITTPLPAWKIEESWKITAKTDKDWYAYGKDENNPQGVKVNSPKLAGVMSPIKYVGGYSYGSVEETNLWANAVTADGSMWVWIPRYAYKITSGYTKKDSKQHNVDAGEVIGTIEIKFIDINNNFLDGTEGKAETDPSKIKYENGTGLQQQWLVHPAFTANPENGGWDKELEGIWVAKFEATGEYDENTNTGTLSVMPGVNSLKQIKINDAYKLAKSSTFGEKVSAEKIGSHMAKNSEWGAAAYLAHSIYGRNRTKVSKNSSESIETCYTGGSNVKSEIYEKNYNQSTTGNATGIYDMNGGAWEFVAGYVNWRNSATSKLYKGKYPNDGVDPLIINGGGSDSAGDLFGSSGTYRSTSTKYKTVYTEARN